jgi:glutathione S-transferase
MTAPLLYEFPHSHFCEIARWALDHKGLPYRSVPLFPGLHAVKMKRLAGESTVPVFVDGGNVIQGSASIIDYLDRAHPDKRLTPDVDATAIETLETEIAETIGVPLRRLCYSYLLSDPDMVRYFFMHRSGFLANLAFRAMYGTLKQRISEKYDCTERGAESAKAGLARAIAVFDERLADRRFLLGDAFSRADISFASLLVFIAMPPEYPVAWPQALAEHELTHWFQGFKGSRSYQQVEYLYANFRKSKRGESDD